MVMNKHTQLQPDTSTNTNDPTRPTKSRCCCYVKCFLCTLLFLIILITVLILTIFKVRNPIMTLNKITLNRTWAGPVFQSGSNISFNVDVSVNNPNPATFKFSNTTSNIYYGGILVGLAHGPPGQAMPWRTLRMNITVGMMMNRVLGAPNLSNDIGSGVFTMDSNTRVPGRVKMLLFVKKHVVVEMNCTVSFNVVTQEIQNQTCKRNVDIKL